MRVRRFQDTTMSPATVGQAPRICTGLKGRKPNALRNWRCAV